MKLNNSTVCVRLRMLVPMAVSLTLLTACGTNPFRSEQTGPGKQGRVITVASNPSGATIRANGNKLGETPMAVNIDKSFPGKWVSAEDYGIVRRVSGTLIIEKSGCDDYTVPVTHTDPAEDINVTLVCIEEEPTQSPAGATTSVMPESVEQRLNKLDTLYRDGVISIEEYNRHRNRILGEL